MAGKRGRSGRYKALPEHMINEVGNLSIRALIKALRDDSITPLEKAKLALPVVQKRMPDKIEIDDKNALPQEEKLKLVSLVREALIGRRNTPDQAILPTRPLLPS